MKYNTILTSKGTTTIPAEIRRQLGVKPGMFVSFSKEKTTGEYVIRRSQTIEELRVINKTALKTANTSHKQYKSGEGFNKLVAEKYGKQK